MKKQSFEKFLAKVRDKRDIAVVAAVVMVSDNALAAGGVVQLLQNIEAIGKEGVVAATIIFFLLGMLAFGYGGKMIWDRSHDRQGDQNTWGKILSAFAGGTVMTALGLFAAMAVVSAGGSESDMGRRINIQ